jgi:hypothetical protein
MAERAPKRSIDDCGADLAVCGRTITKNKRIKNDV